MSVAVERWEACGNVYLLLERAALDTPLTAARARALADPQSGLGGDGILELFEADGVDVAMRIWNPDGSITEACGNGTRMAARWASARTGRTQITVGTDAGPLQCTIEDEQIRAKMARVAFEGPHYAPSGGSFPYPHLFVSIGNPHVVIPVDDVASFPLATEGPTLEHHPWFPERTNVEVSMPIGPRRIRMRVWERGVGETAACGTGACAAAVAAVQAGVVTSPVTVEVPGGELVVDLGANGSVTLSGPARRLETIELSGPLLHAVRG